jgi:hypothetical protein
MYFQVTAKCEEVNESSYTRQLADGSQELVEKVQFSLVVPGMRDRVLCEMPKLAAPKPDTLDKWELEEAWIVVSADGIRALGFARTNARAGEKAVGALVVFQANEVREASADERRALQQARKAQKVRAKQQRAQRQVERQAARAEELKQSA